MGGLESIAGGEGLDAVSGILGFWRRTSCFRPPMRKPCVDVGTLQYPAGPADSFSDAPLNS
jgi:hypothetical protein